jgi:hypothetical protein
MKKTILFILFVLISVVGFGQTMNTTGNWNDPTKWSGGNIANIINENASISTNVTPTIVNGDNITVGNINLVQDNTLNVNNGGQITLGASSTPKTLTIGVNTKLEIKGTLTIWGDLLADNNIDISITGGGKLIIHGKLFLNGNTNINMSGGSTIEIFGDFDGGFNNNVSLSGSNSTVLVHGNVKVDGGSYLNPGSGLFQFGGTCNDGSSNFCNNAISNPALPIELLSFTGYIENGKPKLLWTTASEKNNDHFVISRYENGELWKIGTVQGAGTSNQLNKYQWIDESSNLTGKLYYQLKQVDYDGKSETFNIIIVDMNTRVIEGFVVGDDERVISTFIVDELGRPTSAETGLRIIRLQTNMMVYTRKEYVQN